MATNQNIIPARLSSRSSIPPQHDSPRAEVTQMFRAALDLAHLQIIVDGDGARCASCRATAAREAELSHSIDCAADHVLRAWNVLKDKVSRKPVASVTVLSPTSAA